MSSEDFPTLHTSRLTLRLADPYNAADCEEVIRVQTASNNAVSGMKTPSDVQEKFKRHGPRSEFCTLAPPPRGMFFLGYSSSESTSDQQRTDKDSKGELVGYIILSFRAEMPYPDLGFALFPQYAGMGYASEAGKAVIRFWQEEIGVKEIFIATAPYNVKAQKLAERLGFVRAGSFDVVFGHPPNEQRESDGVALVLPGMKWEEGKTMMLTVGKKEDEAA